MERAHSWLTALVVSLALVLVVFGDKLGAMSYPVSGAIVILSLILFVLSIYLDRKERFRQ